MLHSITQENESFAQSKITRFSSNKRLRVAPFSTSARAGFRKNQRAICWHQRLQALLSTDCKTNALLARSSIENGVVGADEAVAQDPQRADLLGEVHALCV